MFSNYTFHLNRSGDTSSLILHSKREGTSQILRFFTGSRPSEMDAPLIKRLEVVGNAIRVHLEKGGFSQSAAESSNHFDFLVSGEKEAKKALRKMQAVLWPRRFRLLKITAMVIASLFVLDQIASATMGEMVRQAQLENAQQLSEAANPQYPAQGGDLSVEPYRFDPKIKTPEVPMPELSCK